MKNNNTKWNSKLFRNQHTKPDDNIDLHNMGKNKESMKNKDEMKIIYEMDNESIDQDGFNLDKDDNLKEGLFARDEFTGYGYDDPEHTGLGGALNSADIGDLINKIYDKAVYFITYTSEQVVEQCDKRDNNESDQEYKNRKEKNVEIVRKYVALFFSILAGFYAVYNWYYVTTYKSSAGERIPIATFLFNRKNDKNEKKNVIDDLDNLRKGKGIKSILGHILFFFFGYVVMFFDDFNNLIVNALPNLISETFGKSVTFVFLFLLILSVFYFFIESVKNELVNMLKGKLTWISIVPLLYVIFKIGESYISDDPNSHYLSNWRGVLDNVVNSNAIVAPFLLGFYLVINIVRIFIILMSTVLWVPAVVALCIIFYSFFPLILFNDLGVFESIKKIDEHCTESFKVDKKDLCMGSWQKFIYWLKFFVKTLLGDFLYHGLFTAIVIVIFVIALNDYNVNIQGSTLKNNLVNYSYILIVVASIILIKQCANRFDYQFTQGGWKENKENKFVFDENKIDDDLLNVINEKVDKLNELANNNTVKNVFN